MSELLVIPYSWSQGDPNKNTVIMDAYAAHSDWVTSDTTLEERRVLAAWYMTNPTHRIWEVWNGGTIVGILLLSRVIPNVDALFHFVFFDKNLIGKRKLLLRFLGRCYTEMGFRRISIEVPDDVEGLLRFVRFKLGFHFEGEGVSLDHPVTQALSKGAPSVPRMQDPQIWIARQGSRREGAHWRKGAWHDILLLRQFQPEYDALMKEAECPQV